MRKGLWRTSLIAMCVSAVLPAVAGKFTPADFPLRVHILFRNGFRHYRGFGGGISSLEEVDGMGQANLFENGQPLGFDFTYQCGQPLMHQTAFETFMARWKKPGREIEIVTPVIGGKPGEMNSCDMKVTMKQNTAYVMHNGSIAEEPAAEFKAWMTKHQYDPEHGKDMPVNQQAEKAAGQPASGAEPAQ